MDVTANSLLVLLLVGLFVGHAASLNCKPHTPWLKKINEKAFSGLWYVDSSNALAYYASTCAVHDMQWIPRNFTHDNINYHGYWNYLFRRDDLGGQRLCWKHCAFDKGGQLHGWQDDAPPTDCNMTLTNHDATNANNDFDPCYDHGQGHGYYYWDLYVLKTDYRRYAVIWLCNKFGNPNMTAVVIFSRTKKNLPDSLRKELYAYLQRHGINDKLIETHNTSC